MPDTEGMGFTLLPQMLGEQAQCLPVPAVTLTLHATASSQYPHRPAQGYRGWICP